MFRTTRRGNVFLLSKNNRGDEQHHKPKRRLSCINKKAAEAAFVIVPLRREDIGAGEGIRTLDPNLGKVMLYP
jgi:hypothetical protein